MSRSLGKSALADSRKKGTPALNAGTGVPPTLRFRGFYCAQLQLRKGPNDMPELIRTKQPLPALTAYSRQRLPIMTKDK